MNLRKIVVSLVFVFFLMLVAFSVFMGGYGLCLATDDIRGSVILWWVAMFILMLIVIDLVLLVISVALAYSIESNVNDREEISD